MIKKIKVFIPIFLLFVTIGLTGCAQDPVLKRVSKAEFAKSLKNDNEKQIIDVRTPGEFNAGYIEGAINIDFLSASFEKEINKLDKSKFTLVYCQSGGRSLKSLEVFRKNGFIKVLELEGGYGSWK